MTAIALFSSAVQGPLTQALLPVFDQVVATTASRASIKPLASG
jgi:hypothetical protein